MTTTSDEIAYPVVLLGGGIGAGKSRVAEVFAERGFEVVEADKVGHAVLEHDAGAIAAVAALWPDVVRAGVVDRAALGAIVFRDRAELAKLEAITHPAIAEELERHIVTARGPVVVEIPLIRVLAQGPYARVAIVADEIIRESRAVERGASRDDVRRRMLHQPTDEEWTAWADHVIHNSGSWDVTVGSTISVIDEVLRDG